MKKTTCPACRKSQSYSTRFIRGLPGGLEPDGRLKCRCGCRFFPDEHLPDTQSGYTMFPVTIEKRT